MGSNWRRERDSKVSKNPKYLHGKSNEVVNGTPD